MAAAEVIKYAKAKICQSVFGEWSDFWLDHLAFCPINIMIFIGKVLSLAINQEVWKCQRKSREPAIK